MRASVRSAVLGHMQMVYYEKLQDLMIEMISDVQSVGLSGTNTCLVLCQNRSGRS